MTMIQNPSRSTFLILGGARSGKSRYAESIASQFSENSSPKLTYKVTYIATAIAFDDEMESRIERHKNDRPSHWNSIEEPIHLTDALTQNSGKDKIILIDCLTLWLNNLLLKEDSELLNSEINKFLNCINTLQGTIIFVSNEVGMGVIPLGEITRKFVDESGRLHQQLAQLVDHVTLMVAGIPMLVKGQKPF